MWAGYRSVLSFSLHLNRNVYLFFFFFPFSNSQSSKPNRLWRLTQAPGTQHSSLWRHRRLNHCFTDSASFKELSLVSVIEGVHSAGLVNVCKIKVPSLLSLTAPNTWTVTSSGKCPDVFSETSNSSLPWTRRRKVLRSLYIRSVVSALQMLRHHLEQRLTAVVDINFPL